MADSMMATGGNNHIDEGNLGGLLDKALQLEQPNEAVVAEVAAPIVQETKVETIAEVVQPLVSNEQNVWEPPPGSKIKVKLDGKEELVSADEYRDSLQRGATWTKRMQTLADQRRQAEQELANMYANLQIQAQAIELAKQQAQPNLVQQLQALSNQQNVKQPKPDEVATFGEVQQTLDSKLEQLVQKLQTDQQKNQQDSDTKLQNALLTLQRQAQAQQYTNGLKQVLGDKEFEILYKVSPSPEYVEAAIRHSTAKMDPQSMEQSWEFARDVARQWAQNIKQSFVANQQQQEVVKAKQVLEPSTSGSPQGPQKPQAQTIFRKDGSIDWSSLGQRAHQIASQLEV